MASGTSTYRRMFHRWEILRGWLPAIVFAALALALELFYFNYVVSLGFNDEAFTVPIFSLKVPLSIALFLSLGNSVVVIVLWMTVFENTAYVMAGPDRQVRRVLFPLRMIRTAALVLTPFTLVLFTPYIVVSSWFIGLVSGIAGSVPSLRETAIGFYSWAFGLSATDPAGRFVASQILAALFSTLFAGLQIWRVKGTRNMMLLLRRKR